MNNQYTRIGDWSTAVGGYIPGSERIPGWRVWLVAVVVMVAFFGVVPAVGYLAGL